MIKSPVIELAEELQLDLSEVPPNQQADAVCIRVLHNIHNATSETTRALHWHGSMVYTGIGAGQVEQEIERALMERLTNREQLAKICDRIDDVAKAAAKLDAELQHLLPHQTMNTEHRSTLSSWKGGIGTACNQLHYTHQAFNGSCKSTANRIRAVLKKMDAADAAAAQDAYEKTTMHQQFGMAV